MKIIKRLARVIIQKINFLIYKRWFYSTEGKLNKSKLLHLKNKYQGRRCFIIGNGPSLSKCDLSILKDDITIASNRNYLVWDEWKFKPNILTVEDDLIAKNWAGEFNELTGIIKIYPRDLCTFLLPDEDTIYVNFIRLYKYFPKFSLKFDDEVFWGGTVTAFNLQLAYFLGFKEIYLIGCDHNYQITKDEGGVLVKDAELNNSVNYMHHKYMEKGKSAYAPNVERMELGYEECRNVLETVGVKVYNATVGGNLEVFERKDYMSLF